MLADKILQTDIGKTKLLNNSLLSTSQSMHPVVNDFVGHDALKHTVVNHCHGTI